MAESTDLSLDYLFTTTAGQTYTYTILGEKSKMMSADEIIKVDVPIADMNRLLTYSSNWPNPPGSVSESGWQPLPAVHLRLPTVLGSLLDDITHGLTGGQTGAFPAEADKQSLVDSSGTPRQTLPHYFRQLTSFVYKDDSGITCNHLSLIPVEAIEKFVTSDVDTLPLSQVIPDLYVASSAGETGPKSEDLPAAVQALFEQAVDAGLVQPAGHTFGQATDLSGETGTFAGVVSELGTLDGAGAPTGGAVYGAQWAVDQTFGFYVRFDLTKARTFDLSNELNPNSDSVSTEIVFGGVTFDPSAVDNEVSDVVSKTYQIVLKAVAE